MLTQDTSGAACQMRALCAAWVSRGLALCRARFWCVFVKVQFVAARRGLRLFRGAWVDGRTQAARGIAWGCAVRRVCSVVYGGMILLHYERGMNKL